MTAIDPGPDVCIDRNILPFQRKYGKRGRINAKWNRVRMYVCCPVSKKLRGYTYNFSVFIGKQEDKGGIRSFNLEGKSSKRKNFDLKSLNTNTKTCSNKNSSNSIEKQKLVSNSSSLNFSQKISKSEKIVLQLVNKITNEGRQIILDKDLNSIQLANKLYKVKTYTLGTIKSYTTSSGKANLPPMITGKGSFIQQPQQPFFVRKDNILLIKYDEKKTTYLLSTKHLAEDFMYKNIVIQNPVNTTRSNNRKFTKFIKKPLMMKEYQLQMESLDQSHDLLQNYEIVRKFYTWYKKLCMHLISRMTLNAKIIFDLVHATRPVYYSEFVNLLVTEGLCVYNEGAKEIIEKFPTRKKITEAKKAVESGTELTSINLAMVSHIKESTIKKKRKQEEDDPPIPDIPNSQSQKPEIENESKKKKRRYIKRLDTSEVAVYKHILQVIPSTEKVRYPRKVCRICTKKVQHLVETRCRYACFGCVPPAGLCSKKCFEEYHGQELD